jgi:hypothetical protein
MANEQAEQSALESNDLAGLADFLDEQPEMDSIDEDEAESADETISDGDTVDEADDGQDIDPDEPDGESEDEPTPTETKITFKVKNADGQEETVEATTEEIAKSYMRQKDYTAKTTALAQRESEAVEFLKTKHDEVRSHYLQQAEVTRAAVVQMAGIKTEAEMAQLANTDPASWVAESQRQKAIATYLSQLDQQINGEKQAAQQEMTQRQMQQKQQAYQKAWTELSQDGIDKPKLADIYAKTTKLYGFSSEELSEVYDARMVRVLKDAAAFRELQSQKKAVTQKVQDAPKLQSRKPAPAQERQSQALENKFKGGRAKLNDLAAYLR